VFLREKFMGHRQWFLALLKSAWEVRMLREHSTWPMHVPKAMKTSSTNPNSQRSTFANLPREVEVEDEKEKRELKDHFRRTVIRTRLFEQRDYFLS
jgi:hypothetical protein